MVQVYFNFISIEMSCIIYICNYTFVMKEFSTFKINSENTLFKVSLLYVTYTHYYNNNNEYFQASNPNPKVRPLITFVLITVILDT